MTLSQLFKTLMGSNNHSDQIVENKRLEIHAIKNEMTRDSVRVKRKIDHLYENTQIKLSEISADMDTITYKVAIASGAKNRGLR